MRILVQLMAPVHTYRYMCVIDMMDRSVLIWGVFWGSVRNLVQFSHVHWGDHEGFTVFVQLFRLCKITLTVSTVAYFPLFFTFSLVWWLLFTLAWLLILWILFWRDFLQMDWFLAFFQGLFWWTELHPTVIPFFDWVFVCVNIWVSLALNLILSPIQALSAWWSSGFVQWALFWYSARISGFSTHLASLSVWLCLNFLKIIIIVTKIITSIRILPFNLWLFFFVLIGLFFVCSICGATYLRLALMDLVLHGLVDFDIFGLMKRDFVFIMREGSEIEGFLFAIFHESLREIGVAKASGDGLFRLAAFIVISILAKGLMWDPFSELILNEFFKSHKVDFFLFIRLKMIINGINPLNTINPFEIKTFKTGLINTIINDFKFGLEVSTEIIKFIKDVFGLVHVVGLYFLEQLI